MQLVQLLLPVRDANGRPFRRTLYEDLATRLTDEFGGVTAYSRSPAAGFWEKPDSGRMVRDDVVVFEVMVNHLDEAWWRDLRAQLERTFEQEELVIRALEMRRL